MIKANALTTTPDHHLAHTIRPHTTSADAEVSTRVSMKSHSFKHWLLQVSGLPKKRRSQQITIFLP